jgi:small subunit ribosomal protein S11
MSEENSKSEEEKDEKPKSSPKDEVVKATDSADSEKSDSVDDKASKKKEVKSKASKKEEVLDATDSDASEKSDSVDDKATKKKEETAADLLGANIEQVKVRKAKGSKNISSGICFIVATFNNTKVSFSDMKGNVISWSSSGKCNFRGSRKSTAYAAQVVTQDAGKVAMSHGMKEVVVKVKGPGMGRDSAIRALQSLGFTVSTIIDVTPVPHNGCRPPKRRRV